MPESGMSRTGGELVSVYHCTQILTFVKYVSIDASRTQEKPPDTMCAAAFLFYQKIADNCDKLCNRDHCIRHFLSRSLNDEFLALLLAEESLTNRRLE